MRTICLICMLCLAVVVKAASPIQGLLERIDKGASRKFVIEQVKANVDRLRSMSPLYTDYLKSQQ